MQTTLYCINKKESHKLLHFDLFPLFFSVGSFTSITNDLGEVKMLELFDQPDTGVRSFKLFMPNDKL